MISTEVFFFFLGGGGGVIYGPSRLIHSFWAESIAKTGDPREKPPDHPQAELVLSHIWLELGSNPQRWDDERIRTLKISGINHSATWTAFYGKQWNIDFMEELELWSRWVAT